MANKPLLRIGVMCNGTVFPAWQARCLQQLLALEGVRVALLIVNAEPPPVTTRLQKLIKLLRFDGALWAIYQRWCQGKRARALQPVDMTDTFSGVPRISCQVVRKGKFSQYFNADDIEVIRDHQLDICLRFGFGIIRGELLKAPRFGVWSFHHGDEDKYRGIPPGFWEIYHGDPVTGSILQRLTDRLDGGIILHKGYFRTIARSYVLNRDAAFMGSADWPARVCKDIQNGHAGYLDAAPSTSRAPIFRRPTNWQMLRFFWGLARNILTFQFSSRFRLEQWNIGIVHRPLHTLLTTPTVAEAEWLPESAPNSFLADPFGLLESDDLTLLVEQYDYQARKGFIAAVERTGPGCYAPPVPVFTPPVHSSYPFLLRHQGRSYCIPETFGSREVSLYCAKAFPYDWTKVGILIENFAAVDPTVFQHNGYWWLFCTDWDVAPNSILYAWYATDLLGPWQPHGANPIKTDVRSSRPAGTPFVHEGVLYRPAQDCARRYGDAVVLNRVIRLTPTEFEEVPVTVVKPDLDGPYPHGLHTLSAAGAMTIVDGRRLMLSSRVLHNAVVRMFKRVVRHRL